MRLIWRAVASAIVAAVCAAMFPSSAWAGASGKDVARRQLLRAVDFGTGETLWNARPGRRSGTLVVQGRTGNVVVAKEIPCTENPAPDAVLGFDATTGHELWRRPSQGIWGEPITFGVDVLVGAPTVAWGEYGGGGNMTLHGVVPRTGEDVWSETGPQPDLWPIGSTDDLVITGPDNTRVSLGLPSAVIRARERSSGQVRWSVEIPTDGAKGIDVAGDRATVIVTAGSRVWGIDAPTGTTRWESTIGSPATTDSMVVLIGAVVVMSRYVQGSGLTETIGMQAVDGRILWSGSDVPVYAQWSDEPPIALGLQFDEDDGSTTVAGVDPSTGATRWTRLVPAVRWSPRQETVGQFFLSTRRYVVVSRKLKANVLDVRNGDLRRSIELPAGTKNAIAVGSRLYIAGGCSASSA